MTNIGEPVKNMLIRSLVQMLVIISISVFAGLASNVMRSSPMPLIGDWSNKAQLTTTAGEELMVSLEDAKTLFNDQAAVFVDARSRADFKTGHIKDALSLPWHQAQELFMEVIPNINPDVLIITYCDGESCTLSHDLAFFLKDLGFQVRVLVNGWSLWSASGMPVEGDIDA